MKFGVSFLVSVAVLWVFASKYADPATPVPPVLIAIGTAFVIVLPLSLGCRFVTKRVPGAKARLCDLVLLFIASGIYAFLDDPFRSAAPDSRTAFLWWLSGTWILWSTLFLPFGFSVFLFEFTKDIMRRSHKTHDENR